MAHLEDDCGPPDSRTEHTNVSCAQVFSRTHILETHRVLPRTSTQSPLLRNHSPTIQRGVAQGRDSLTSAESPARIGPPIALGLRAASVVLESDSLLRHQNARQQRAPDALFPVVKQVPSPSHLQCFHHRSACPVLT